MVEGLAAGVVPFGACFTTGFASVAGFAFSVAAGFVVSVAAGLAFSVPAGFAFSVAVGFAAGFAASVAAGFAVWAGAGFATSVFVASFFFSVFLVVSWFWAIKDIENIPASRNNIAFFIVLKILNE
ncbi:MAG TPA: hypothetical protein PKN12_10510 [Bacteroidales bacterium]|nr:hypothetical protein [Bacteroidales bacterium]HPT10740.1 hypothetical protein [Bacteroidales bacterium]